MNARDYVSLAPIEVNRSGERHYYWFGYLWSTIDRRDGESLLASRRSVRAARRWPPDHAAGCRGLAARARHRTRTISRPGRAAVALLLQADPGSVSFAGHASGLSLVLIHDGQNQDYALWRDAREAVSGLVTYLGLDSPVIGTVSASPIALSSPWRPRR